MFDILVSILLFFAFILLSIHKRRLDNMVKTIDTLDEEMQEVLVILDKQNKLSGKNF